MNKIGEGSCYPLALRETLNVTKNVRIRQVKEREQGFVSAILKPPNQWTQPSTLSFQLFPFGRRVGTLQFLLRGYPIWRKILDFYA